MELYVCVDRKEKSKYTNPGCRKRLRQYYNTLRKKFSRAVQRTKRRYWYSMREDLLNQVKHDQIRFGGPLEKLV